MFDCREDGKMIRGLQEIGTFCAALNVWFRQNFKIIRVSNVLNFKKASIKIIYFEKLNEKRFYSHVSKNKPPQTRAQLKLYFIDFYLLSLWHDIVYFLTR